MAANGLSVRRGERTVIEGVDLEIRAGELLVLVGPNGAGKSSLLAALTGELPPSAGAVTVEGRPMSQWSSLDLARRRSLLPQSNRLAFSFTVAEVVAMGRAPWRGTSREAEDDAVVAEVMAQTEITGYADRHYTALSGGEQGRVALARVMAQRTGILLLDEPTAALDLHHQELVLRLARRRARDNCAVIVVLHDLSLAAAYADRIALLDGGFLAGEGTPAEVCTESVLSKVYRHDVEVLPHPRTGKLLIIPRQKVAEREAGQMTVNANGFFGQVIAAARSRQPWLKTAVRPGEPAGDATLADPDLAADGAEAHDSGKEPVAGKADPGAKTGAGVAVTRPKPRNAGNGRRAAVRAWLAGRKPKPRRPRPLPSPARRRFTLRRRKNDKLNTPRLSRLADLPSGDLEHLGDLARVLNLPPLPHSEPVLAQRIDTQVDAERATLRAAVPRLRELIDMQVMRRRQAMARKEIEIAHLHRVRAVTAEVEVKAAQQLAASDPEVLIPRRPYLNLAALSGATAITLAGFYPILTSVTSTFPQWLSWATVAGFAATAVTLAHAAGVMLRKKAPVWQPALLILVWTVLGVNAVTTLLVSPAVSDETTVLTMNFISLYLAGGVISLLTAYTRYNPVQAAHRAISGRLRAIDSRLARAEAEHSAEKLDAERLTDSYNGITWQLEVLENQRVALYGALRSHLRLHTPAQD
jgi:iron complex transport system ATP-binding protein